MPKRFATQASSRVRRRRRVRGQRPAAFGKQLLPALRVTVFDDRELLEELLPFAIGFDRGQRAIEIGGVAFVAVMLVPGLVCLRRFGVELIG